MRIVKVLRISNTRLPCITISVDAITVGLSSLDIIIKDIRKGIASRSNRECRIMKFDKDSYKKLPPEAVKCTVLDSID